MACEAEGLGARPSPRAGTARAFDARNCRATSAEIEGKVVSGNDFVKWFQVLFCV
jgi:hypothetical protein